MGAATTSDKSPKPPRPPKSPLFRQVHFADTKKDNSVKVTTAAEYAAKTNNNINHPAAKSPTPVTAGVPTPTTTAQDTFAQPTSFPALGQFAPQQNQQQQPTSGLPGGPGQWYTSVNPAASVNSWQYSGQGQGPAHPHQPQAHSHLSCSHHQHQPHQTHPHPHGINMSYQNTAPPPTGVCFQPPVPDNSNGPMTHVYIPRFDGGLPQQAPFPHNQFMGAGGQPGVHQHGPGCNHAQGLGYVAQPQPVYLQQPPMMMAQGAHPPSMAQPGPHFQHGAGTFIGGGHGAGIGAPPFLQGNTGPVPEVAGLGRTAGEEQLRQHNFATGNKMFEPQDFKPSDDDPSRFYYVRELDGNWTQRNRFSIDHMGDSRWYVTDEGWFYAIRLPN